MSDITISVIQPPSTTINVGVDETTLIQAGIGLPPHSVTHISGGSDEINHNLLGGLQGGSGNEFYHLNSGQYFNLVTGDIVRPTETGQFYSSSNPSGYTATGYVTGVSGNLQTQITSLNNQTGSFYPRTNPSGYITGINNIVFTTGNQIISGAKTFTGSFNVSTNDAILIRSTGYTNGVEIGGSFFNKIADGGFINDFGVNGTENHFGDSATSSNSFGGSAVQNDFGAYATLNNYYAGFGIGQFDFDTRPTVSGTGVLLEGEIPDTGYLSNYVNKNETGDFYPRTNPSGYISGISNLVFTTGNQTISGAKTFSNNLVIGANDLFVNTSTDRVGIFTSSPTATLDVNGSGLFRSGLSTQYVSGVSGSSLNIIGYSNSTITQTQRNINIAAGSGTSTISAGDLILMGGGLSGVAPNILKTGASIIIGGATSSTNNITIKPSIDANASAGNVVIEAGLSPTYNGKINMFGDVNINGTTDVGAALSSKNINIYRRGDLFGSPSQRLAISIDNNNANFQNGMGLQISGVQVTPSLYASSTNLASTGLVLDGKINNLSGYVTGISGGLQTQITTLNNTTGSYVLNTQTGVFYPTTNPSGFITGVDLSFSGNYYTKNESESRYVNTTGAETILGDKTFHDKVYINNLYVTGLETIVNTTNTNVASNYIMLNLTGGAVDGGIFFVTGSGLTGVNDSGAIIGFDHSDKFKFGIATRASDLSTLDTIAAYEEVTGISGSLQTQISTLNNTTGSYALKIETGNFITNSQTGQFYSNSNPSGFITGIDLSSYATQVYVTGISGNLQGQITNLNNATGSYVLNSQTGQFYPNSNPSGFITGVDFSSYATQSYVTGISGNLQSQITNLNNATGSYILNSQTGDFYANSNPSGFITGIENIVFTTGDQTISGIKTFSTGVNVTGDVNINGNLTISGQYNVYQQIENAKILAIAYAIAL